MAIVNAYYGKLLYVRVCAGEIDNYFPEYLVLFNYKNERQEILDRLEMDAAELKNGIEQKRPDLVSHIAKDRSLNWLCKIPCPYRDKCDQMRIEAGELSSNK